MSRFDVRLGRGATLNKTLIDCVFPSKGRYFVRDIYGATAEVDKKHYNEIVKIMGVEIIRKKEDK